MLPASPTPPAAAPAPTSSYSGPLRLWHWGNALLVAGQLLTILFLLVIVQPRALVPDFQRALGQSGSTLSPEQGRALAHIISERIWAWHINIGLALAAFWLFWLMVQLTAPAGQRFGARLAAAARHYRLAPPTARPEARHTLAVKLSYAAFYIFLTVMVLTGLALTWADEVAWLGKLERPVKQVHNVTMYLILAFVALHIGGVVWAELTRDHGLISRMIGGKSGKSS